MSTESALETGLPSLNASYTQNPTQWWHDQMRSEASNPTTALTSSKKCLDVFSSIGGLALGAQIAIHLQGQNLDFVGAVDTDGAALKVHQYNFDTEVTLNESVRDLVDFRVTTSKMSGLSEFRYATMTGDGQHIENSDLLIGGPPCQGHSTLNNRTRSFDPKNQLMLTMPAIAVARGIPAVVIENVPNVVNDSRDVVRITQELFETYGYHVRTGVIAATDLGWPQTRRRFFMVARLDREPIPFDDVISAIGMPSQSVSWCLDDLVDAHLNQNSIMNTVPKMNADNLRRVQWLFDNNEYDLPNHERPKCHQEGHTYPSMYGRMSWNAPAPTITTGFQTPGRGRFIHPLKPRVLTPHEAARIQGFPDWFNFKGTSQDEPNRSNISKWIGDAVPSILGAAAVLSATA